MAKSIGILACLHPWGQVRPESSCHPFALEQGVTLAVELRWERTAQGDFREYRAFETSDRTFQQEPARSRPLLPFWIRCTAAPISYYDSPVRTAAIRGAQFPMP
ncbi:MAG: hypothetical protein CL908_11690 [Deltaproteobacteria bacterium]|nr:hypothetical protein [Deltaproteobacteria bacterium]